MTINSEHPLTFYSQMWCPKSQSILLALEASGLPHTTVNLAVDDKNHVCSDNEKSQPALVQNGNISKHNYKEAVQFLHGLDGANTKQDAAKKTKQDRILDHFFEHILPYFEKSVVLDSPREGLDLFIEASSFLENELVTAGGPYFGGREPSFADYGLFPYFDKVGKWFQDFDDYECPRIKSWIRVMRQHPLVVKVLKETHTNDHLARYTEDVVNRKS
ncbi:glutathione S-transferase omega-1 [Ciona intestinalis]